jgi:hypothetical protein
MTENKRVVALRTSYFVPRTLNKVFIRKIDYE